MEIERKKNRSEKGTKIVAKLFRLHFRSNCATVANRIIFIASIFTSKAIKFALILHIFWCRIRGSISHFCWNVVLCNFDHSSPKLHISSFVLLSSWCAFHSIRRFFSTVLLSINKKKIYIFMRDRAFFFVMFTHYSLDRSNAIAFRKSNQELAVEKGAQMNTNWRFSKWCESNTKRLQMHEIFYDLDDSSSRKTIPFQWIYWFGRIFCSHCVCVFFLYRHY